LVPNGDSYDLPLDVFEEGEKRPEKDRKKRHRKGPHAKNGDSPASDVVSLEPRKRKQDSSDTSLAKKPNVNSTELNGSFKRALDTEVCALPSTE
jgi:hypothetical protein